MSAARWASASQPVRWIGQPTQPITGVISANCSQWFINTIGIHPNPKTSRPITANNTGKVSTAPTSNRRDRPTTSARRAAASTSSLPSAGTNSSSSYPTAVLSDAVDGSPSTNKVPWIMFIPHANPYDPGRVGVNSTVVCANGARKRLNDRSANTTRDEQSPSSWRSNTIRTGNPVRAWITSGL